MTNSDRHRPTGTLAAVCSLIALAAAALLLAPVASAAPSPIVSPKAGSVVHKHRVRLEVRAGDTSSALVAKLNGVDVTADFGRSKAGIRTMSATISHGLRRGQNRLRVKVRKRGKPVKVTSTRFRVRRSAPLVGAGRDRDVVVGSRTRLLGDLRNGSRSKLRWRLVNGPRPAEAKQAVTGNAAAKVRLMSPGGPTAGFVPRSPGRYVFALTHGGGNRAVSDRVTVSALPPSPLVPVDTMSGSTPGIKVGEVTYPNDGGLIQTVVLDRKTLAFVSNRTYYDTADLDADLKQLDDEKLVIVAANGDGPLSQAWAGLVTSLRQLGIDLGQRGYDDGIQPHWFSAIGVPGLPPGSADVRYRVPPGFPHSGDREGEIVGYLTPDQYGNFGFASPQKEEFSLGGEEVPPCGGGIPACGDTHIGFRLGVRDPYDYEPGPGDGEVFDTNGRGLSPQQQTNEATRMADALDAVPPDFLVTIEAVSNRRPEEASYPAPVGAVDKAAMTRLAQSVADAGGTRNGFNRAARVTGVPASGGDVYVMAGWHGAGEGNGEESAAGVDTAGDVPELSGVLRPGLDTMLKPTESVEASEYTNELSDLALATPDAGWPLDDNPGAQKAIAYLAKQDNSLSADIRSSYWTMNLDIDGLIRTLGATTYPAGAAFSAADFDAAKAEILQELQWVGKVRSYLDQLSKPFSDTGLQNWAAVQTIAERIHEQAEADKSKVSVDWLEIISSAFELVPLVGPEGEAAARLTEILTEATVTGISVWGAVDVEGEPFGHGRVVTADELGAEMANQARDAQTSFAALGDVIVSDYEKLKELGTYAGCNPSSPDCPPQWGLDKAGQSRISSSLYLDIERNAYLKLLPLGYKVFSLARKGDLQGHYNRTSPPDPANYWCNTHFIWGKYPDLARSSTSLLQELDPVGVDSEWDTFVFSAEPGGGDVHGTPPPAALLDRMFNPLSPSGDPRIGGLGLVWNQFAVPESLVPEGQRNWWEFNNPVRERDVCSWTG